MIRIEFANNERIDIKDLTLSEFLDTYNNAEQLININGTYYNKLNIKSFREMSDDANKIKLLDRRKLGL